MSAKRISKRMKNVLKFGVFPTMIVIMACIIIGLLLPVTRPHAKVGSVPFVIAMIVLIPILGKADRDKVFGDDTAMNMMNWVVILLLMANAIYFLMFVVFRP